MTEQRGNRRRGRLQRFLHVSKLTLLSYLCETRVASGGSTQICIAGIRNYSTEVWRDSVTSKSTKASGVSSLLLLVSTCTKVPHFAEWLISESNFMYIIYLFMIIGALTCEEGALFN